MTRKLILLSALLLTTILFSCNNNGGKKQKPSGLVKPRQEKVVAVFTLPDSSKNMEIMYRVIGVGVSADSAKGKYDVKIDSAWYIIRNLEEKDSTGKVKVDSTGKAKTKENLFFVNKDSVNWHIAGVPVDTLLKKTYPPRGRE